MRSPRKTTDQPLTPIAYQPNEGSPVIGGAPPPPASFAGDLPGERGGSGSPPPASRERLPTPPASGEVRKPAAAIMAALSVHSSRGGIVRRARVPTTSAARWRRSVFAATPPETTTSPYGDAESAWSSFSSRDSTTERSKEAARSALS